MGNTMDMVKHVNTGQYFFPELPHDHYWVIDRGVGINFLKVRIMRPGFLFPKTVASKSLACFYAETDEGLRPYEPGNHIYQTAMRLRFDAFPYDYPDARESNYYIPELRRGKGTETILDSLYAKNYGKHNPGDNIYHFGS